MAHPESSAILGTDRHGQITSQPVSLQPFRTFGSAVFLGTDGTLGVFADETRLATKAGEIFSARALTEFGNVSELWFENVVGLSKQSGPSLLELFATAVTKRAPFASKSFFARRCVNRDASLSSPLMKRFCKLHRISKELFCVIDNGIFGASEIKPCDLIFELSDLLWGTGEDKTASFEIEDAAAAVWFCSALQTREVHYTISYDSLQHTNFANIRLSQEQQSPFKNARCSFMEPTTREWLKLEWKDTSWSPIVNGFLVKGN